VLAGEALKEGVGTRLKNCVKMMGNVRAEGDKFGVSWARFAQIARASGCNCGFCCMGTFLAMLDFGLRIGVGGGGQFLLVFTGVERRTGGLNYPV
jgi:hypothetical protein